MFINCILKISKNLRHLYNLSDDLTLYYGLNFIPSYSITTAINLSMKLVVFIKIDTQFLNKVYKVYWQKSILTKNKAY